MNDPLREKRRHLVKLLLDLQASRVEFLRNHPEADLSYAQLERAASKAQLERDVSRMQEPMLDDLIARHDPSGSGLHRYVW